MSEIIQLLSRVDPVWIYTIIFLIAYIENLFPPSPSDIIVVFGGALSAMDRGNFWLALNAATIGSTLGFVTMYALGNWFGKKILDEGKIKFFPKERVLQIDAWFAKYGYWIIVGNRFLAGTRAVVSFFAGISHLDPVRTTVLSFVSSLVWYSLLVFGGYSLGNNWEQIEDYLSTYSRIITIITAFAALIIIARYYYKLSKNQNG